MAPGLPIAARASAARGVCDTNHSFGEVGMATTTQAERAASGEPRVDGDRLYRLLHAELSDAGCLRPAPVQSALHGTLVLLGYATAYTTLLTGPGTTIRVLALAALAFLC